MWLFDSSRDENLSQIVALLVILMQWNCVIVFTHSAKFQQLHVKVSPFFPLIWGILAFYLASKLLFCLACCHQWKWVVELCYNKVIVSWYSFKDHHVPVCSCEIFGFFEFSIMAWIETIWRHLSLLFILQT